jgi:hypothetical protein
MLRHAPKESFFSMANRKRQAMWTKRLILYVALFTLLSGPIRAQTNNAVKTALIVDKAFDLHKSPLVSLLEVRLSQREDIHLLERTEIDKILQEQKLNLAGLLERNTAVRVGRLIHADALLLLSIENHQGNKQNEKALLRIRLVETAHGLRLLDSFEQSDSAKLEETAARIAENTVAVAGKLLVPTDAAIPVGIVDIHRVQLGNRHQSLARTLPVMLSVRLSKEPRIIMLEREDLKILYDERLLTEGEDTEFWASAVLIDGYLQRRGSKDIEMKLQVRGEADKEIAAFTVLVEPNEPLTPADRAATQIIQELLSAPPSASWQPEQEAEEFFRQGKLLSNHKRHQKAQSLLETAHALEPKNVLYTGAVFVNEWEARSHQKQIFYSNLELAELVSLLVRQIQKGYANGVLPKSHVLQELGKPLGLATDRRGHLSGYFSKPASVSTDEIRRINRENRRIWTKTVKDAAVDWHGGLPVRTAILKYAAWVSSDKPEEVIENIRESFTKLIMPPEKEAETQWSGHQFMRARAALLFPSLNTLNVQAIEKTHLRGSAKRFQELWIQYLQDLTEREDPIIRFAAHLALAKEYRQRDKHSAQLFCRSALDVLLLEIEELNKPLADFFILNMHRQMSKAIISSGFDPIEAIKIFQRIYDPLIERGDAHSLALWGPGERYRWRFNRSNVSVAKESIQLLERIASVLETRKDSDKEVMMSLNRVRDTMAVVRKEYPRLRSFKKQATSSPRMLLRREDWPNSTNKFQYVRVLRRNDTLWFAFAKPGVGLAGIDLSKEVVVSLRQAECGSGKAVHTGYKGQEINGSITGIAVTEDESYIAIRDIGLIVLRGKNRQGKSFLRSPGILTEENGLPSISITGMTEVEGKLWIAYGSNRKESGLIMYDPKSGSSETLLCSTVKGDNPFCAGKTYEISSLTLGPQNNLFFIVLGRKDEWTEIQDITGLWRINIFSKELKFIWHDPFIRYFLESIEDTGDSLWLRDLELLSRFDPNSEVATIILGDQRTKAKVNPMPKIKHSGFTSDPAPAVELGHLNWGHISLRTAAVEGNKLWARLGESQLIVIEKGKGFRDAEIFENNILEGEKVLRFFSTPYGLIAIGEGTVGLIETKNNEK